MFCFKQKLVQPGRADKKKDKRMVKEFGQRFKNEIPSCKKRK